MTSNLHPLFSCIVELHFPRPKIQPCDHCGPGTCEHFPCENVTHPDYGLVEIRASAGAKE